MQVQKSNFDEFLYAVSHDDHFRPRGIARCGIDSMSVECMSSDGSWVVHPTIKRIAPHVGDEGGLVLTDRAYIPVSITTAAHVVEELMHLTNA